MDEPKLIDQIITLFRDKYKKILNFARAIIKRTIALYVFWRKFFGKIYALLQFFALVATLVGIFV